VTRSDNVTQEARRLDRDSHWDIPENGKTANGAQAVEISRPVANNTIAASSSSLNVSSVGSEATSVSRVKQRLPSGITDKNFDVMLRNVPVSELAAACNGFSPQSLVGKGGFGEVYRGQWQNQEVAVKRIKENRRLTNDQNFQIYVNQAIIELQVMHTYPALNILPLVAYSFTEDLSTEPCLVYLYMPNGAVSDRLKLKNNTPPLTWEQRANIALGTARGLCHLHINNIIHLDIKSGNILLDKHLEPKIGDFGLARGGPEDERYSHITVTSILGTGAYLPDDYRRNHQLHPAVDTFCYGIFLFELVTGVNP
jgi:serine/threonine protein kinase